MTLAVHEIDDTELARCLPEFGDLLHACVEDGASIGFLQPFSPEQGLVYWLDAVLPDLRTRRLVLLAAWDGARLAGSVQLFHGTPGNQPHRAEVRKLLVHPDYRRRGVGRSLMHHLERRARALGRSLITLDTRTGDAAEPLYASLGYEVSGTIPGYCRDTVEDRLDPTTIMYKAL